jgi:hypothetical protein
MQQGWMNGWMDETHQNTKQKMDEFHLNPILPTQMKKHPTFGVCVWRIFLKISKKSRNYTRKNSCFSIFLSKKKKNIR